MLIPFWRELVTYANGLGIRKLCLELHGHQKVYNVESFVRLRNAVGDTVGVNLDPSHPLWMGADPLTAVAALGPAIYDVYAKDARIEAEAADRNARIETKPAEDIATYRAWNYVTLGHGHDEAWWRQFCRALAAVGHDDVLSIEREDVALPPIEGDAQSAVASPRNPTRINSMIFARNALTALALAVILSGTAGPATAQGNLVVYCTVQEEWCRAMVTAFERKTGIKVAMTRKSSGEFYAQVQAEASNPKGDIWWGGTGDPHLQAANEGLTIEYQSANMSQLRDWAVRQWEQSKHRAVGVYAGALGYGYNTELMKKKSGADPKCWADLVDPRFRDEVQVADPNSSGTAYTMLATIVQLMGEDAGFDYLKALHENVNQYTKSGAAPAKATSQGETLIGITFQHDMVTFIVDGAPIKVVSPCEGTGYEIGSMSIIKGARNLDNAQKWYDWALTTEAQSLGGKAKSYQVPSNRNTKPPPQAPDFSQIKFIDYDFAKYGSSAERKRLLAKWDSEVKNLPR